MSATRCDPQQSPASLMRRSCGGFMMVTASNALSFTTSRKFNALPFSLKFKKYTRKSRWQLGESRRHRFTSASTLFDGLWKDHPGGEFNDQSFHQKACVFYTLKAALISIMNTVQLDGNRLSSNVHVDTNHHSPVQSLTIHQISPSIWHHQVYWQNSHCYSKSIPESFVEAVSFLGPRKWATPGEHSLFSWHCDMPLRVFESICPGNSPCNSLACKQHVCL